MRLVKRSTVHPGEEHTSRMMTRNADMKLYDPDLSPGRRKFRGGLYRKRSGRAAFTEGRCTACGDRGWFPQCILCGKSAPSYEPLRSERRRWSLSKEEVRGLRARQEELSHHKDIVKSLAPRFKAEEREALDDAYYIMREKSAYLSELYFWRGGGAEEVVKKAVKRMRERDDP